MKALLSVIALAILSLTVVACAQPVPPTATPYPTYTPYPTLAALPTHTPYPTSTPYPTLEPLPTHTPYPTPSALPTYTPYPTATPAPTYTPYPTPVPTPTLAPTPTQLPERVTYTTYTGWLHPFSVSIPDDWEVEVDYEDDQYAFRPNGSEATALVAIVEKSFLIPLSTYVQLWISAGENRGLEVLESYAVGSKRWYIRGRLKLSICVSEIEQNFHLKGDEVYIVTTSACPSTLREVSEPFSKFHSSFSLQ